MEIYINNKTKAPFILVKELKNGILKLITPKLEIKDLKASFFHGPFDEEELGHEEKKLLNEQQLEKYYAYKEGEMKYKLADLTNWANDNWPGGIDGFFESFKQNNKIVN